MSQRSIRRARQRREAGERRREALRRRRAGLAVTAALGATALFAPGASAATFTVNSLNDGAPDVCDSTTTDGCTLRDAINDANSNGESDVITFAAGLTGTITLDPAQGQLNVNNAVSIEGPGASALTVSGGDATRIFNVSSSGPVGISGLTLAHGKTGGNGGALYASTRTDVTIANSTISSNQASSSGGGLGSAGHLTVTGSLVEGNTTQGAGGGIWASHGLDVSSSTISGNTAGVAGGGIASTGKYAQSDIADSVISGNTAATGGGISIAQFSKYEPAGSIKHAVKSTISGSTISGNKATQAGGGVDVPLLGDGDHLTISHSTLSGNDATSADATAWGGGIHFGNTCYGAVDGEFTTSDTTISGNTANVGGGVSVGGNPSSSCRSVISLSTPELGAATNAASATGTAAVGKNGSIEFGNSTIASNSASSDGGGVYLNQYESSGDGSPLTSPTIALTSTILADNSAGGAANDADRADGSQSGGLDTTFSLVENPGDAPVQKSPAGSTIIGVDPQLGPLGNNGGPTQTQVPSNVSPVIDQGKAPARVPTDQRNLARTVGGDVQDAAGGDGTDIGAAEVQDPAKAPVVAEQQAVLGDRTPPTITLNVPKSLTIQQLIAGFDVTVNCNEPCSMTFRLFGSAPTGTLHSSGFNFRLLNKKIGRKGGKRKVHLQPCVIGSKSKQRTHVCRKRITKALYAKPQKSFKVKLIVAAKDAAGNLSHKKRFIRVHR